MMEERLLSVISFFVLVNLLSPLTALKISTEKINSSLIFFDSNEAYGSNLEFVKTKNSSLRPTAFYPQLFDGKISRTDVAYFWAEKSPLCVHLYFKKMILLDSVAIYVQERQLNNVNRTTGIVTDGVSGSVRQLVLDPGADANSSGWKTLKPWCNSQAPMAVTDRVRICWDLKTVNAWFGIIEIEIYGSADVSLEPNIVRYRTVQSQLNRCAGYLVSQPIAVNDRFKKLRNWLLVFEQPYVLNSLQMLVQLPPGEDQLTADDWAQVRLNNGSVVNAGPCCRFEKAEGGGGGGKVRWRLVRRVTCTCKARLPPALGLSFADGLRVRDLRVFGQPYSKVLDRYPQPELRQKIRADYRSVELLCQQSDCRYLRLNMFSTGRGFVPAIVDGRVQKNTPLRASALNITMSDSMLLAHMPYDFHHAGKYQCECAWGLDDSILLSNVVEVEVFPEKMPLSILRESAIVHYTFEYKFSWDSHYDFKSTTKSYVLFKPTDNEITFRMRILSYVDGTANQSIAYDFRETVQPRQREICRTPNGFCVPGYEYLQAVQYRRLHPSMHFIEVPVWVGFLEDWMNQTIHLHKERQFDFWITQTAADRLLIDIFCPPGARCWGNVSEVTLCASKSPPRELIRVKSGHNTDIVVENIKSRSGYRICFYSRGVVCSLQGDTACNKCREVNPEHLLSPKSLTDLLTITKKETGYSRYDSSGNPTGAFVTVGFKYNAILRCANVGLLNAELLCEDGFEQQLNWTHRRLQLRQFTIDGVPLDASCHIKLQLLSFNNQTERIITDFNTKKSPLDPLVVKERYNGTHAILEWYSDPDSLAEGYLRTYRIVKRFRKCSGVADKSESEQGKIASYAFPLVPTEQYNVTVVRVINFNGSVMSVPSLDFRFIAKPEKVEPLEVIDAIPINRWKMELLLDMKNLTHCFPDSVEVQLGQNTLRAKVSKMENEVIAEVNSSSQQPLETVPILVRGLFDGLTETPWSEVINYTIPMEMKITSTRSMDPGTFTYTVDQGSTEKFHCSCTADCPDGISFSWYRGWRNGELVSRSPTLVIANARPKHSGRYACFYNVIGRTGPRSEGVASTMIMTVKPKASATSNKNNKSSRLESKTFLPSVLVLMGLLVPRLQASC